MIGWQWIINWTGCGWMWSWLNLRHYPRIFLQELRKTMKTSIRIAGLWFKISSWNLLNMKQESRRSNSLNLMLGNMTFFPNHWAADYLYNDAVSTTGIMWLHITITSNLSSIIYNAFNSTVSSLDGIFCTMTYNETWWLLHPQQAYTV
jgi:hypothetical protein